MNVKNVDVSGIVFSSEIFVEYRGVFKALSSIYDEVFLRKS